MNDRRPANQWIKCVSKEGSIRGVAIQATELVQSLAKLHELDEVGARGLGEAVLGALLIASYCKPGERVNLNAQGNGLYKQALVDAHPEGTIRGYVIQSSTSNYDPKKSQTGPWGEGVLAVLRTKGSDGNKPYIGTVPLVTGHLAKDLTYYWSQSEQVPSAVGLVVETEAGNVKSAAAFLVQAMPGASDAELRMIEANINTLDEAAKKLSGNANPMELLSRIFDGATFLMLEEKPLTPFCNCSQERVERAISLIGTQDLQSMLNEEGEAKLRCDFCTKEYHVGGEKLKAILANRG